MLLNIILEVLAHDIRKKLAYEFNVRKDEGTISVAYTEINYLENPRESLRNF
jgi:hypothetical protein